jgi:hypothetical protein
MRTGQKVRVQNGTGPGIGGGRMGQTVHIRAPGGGPLFEHGASIRASYPSPTYTIDWDTDDYATTYGTIYIPADLGGIYLVIASAVLYGDEGDDAISGWLSAYVDRNGEHRLGQWQMGWRAWNTTMVAGVGVNIAWIGELIGDEDAIAFGQDSVEDDFLNAGAVTVVDDIHLSIFRLGAVGDDGFHGALVYKETAYAPSGHDDLVTGSVLFDTDDFNNATEGGLQVPTGLDGLYVMASSWRFTVANMALWGVDLPDWPFGTGFALWPLFYDVTLGPASQAVVTGVDVNDCSAGSNEVAVSALWIGRLRAGDLVASEGICDNEASGNPIVHNEDPIYTYLALVRIAP